jgi:N6-adenosine-specific RNA methylase IME4
MAGLTTAEFESFVAEFQSKRIPITGKDVAKLFAKHGRKSDVAAGAAQESTDHCSISDLHELVASGRKFGVIYADPPWLYDNQATRASTSDHYAGLTVDQLCDASIMPVRELAADNAHLHMWTTNAFLFDAPRIFAAWGFEFRSAFVWVKPQIGIGNYWRNSHEYLLTAIRGNAKRFNDHSMRSWGEFDRRQHSAKPEEIRSLIERASDGPYLELFGRRQAPGWTVWGNDVSRDLLFKEAA